MSQPTLPPASTAHPDLGTAVDALNQALAAMLVAQRRVDSATDETLQGILLEQCSREKEHLVMLLEWMRQKDPVLDEHMRSYLFQREVEPPPATQPMPVMSSGAGASGPSFGAGLAALAAAPAGLAGAPAALSAALAVPAAPAATLSGVPAAVPAPLAAPEPLPGLDVPGAPAAAKPPLTLNSGATRIIRG